MATNPLDKVYLTGAQLQTLASGDSITSGSDTYTADEDTLYLTDDTSVSYESQTLTDAQKAQARSNVAASPSVLTGSSAPTTSTVGEVGQFYLDTTTSKLYQCKAVTEDTSTTPSTFSYTWSEVGGGGGMEVLSGSTEPTTSTVGKLGQLYVVTVSPFKIFLCNRIYNSDTTFSWSNIGSGVDDIYIGTGKTAGKVVIGTTKTVGNYGTAIGSDAQAYAPHSMAIGRKANAGNAATYAIQLGEGTNVTSNTLQVRSDNIYNMYDHTATFKNIQQGVTSSTGVGGNPVYGIIVESSAPDTSTAGSVGQFYLDTTNTKLYICTVADTVTPSYTWTTII